jgi:DNA-binding CsgD family transcriptional regulator/tetratricopeptide (TPR) repeat protein
VPMVPLRGRSEQLALSTGMLRDVVRSGRSRGLVITGEAGIGKSALIAAMLGDASSRGMAFGLGKADRIGRIVPGAPLLAALRDGPEPILASRDFATLEQLSPHPLRLLDTLGSMLEQRAGERPVAVAVDDIQWLDDLSIFLLRSLPARMPGSPIAWLLSSRDPRSGLVERLTSAHAGEPRFIRMELGPLQIDDILAVARDHLGSSPGSADRRMLERTEGNPFLAVQVVNGLFATSMSADDAAEFPAPLLLGARERLKALPAQTADLVRWAAVFGAPLATVDAALLLDDTSARSVSDAAQAAIQAGILTVLRDSVAFRHELVRESVYVDLPDPQRRKMHLRCALHLRASGSDALTVAAHAREALTPGDEDVALLLADAADEAVSLMPGTAAELMLTAFKALRPGQARWLALGERCVDLLSLVQRCNDALAIAAQLAAYLDDDEPIAQLEVALSRALWLTGRWSESEERTREVLQRPELSSGLRTRLEALHSLALSRVRSAEVARPLAEHALAVSGETADRAGRLFALHAMAEIARNLGNHRTSLRYFRELRTESEPTYLAQEIMALQHLDRYDHAGTMLGQSWQQAENDSASILPSLLYAQIWQDFNLGRLDGAETVARTLMGLGTELGSRVCELESAAILGAAALLRGDTGEAVRRISLGGIANSNDEAHIPVLVLVRGWLAAEEGRSATAVEILSPLLAATGLEQDPWPWKPGWMRMLTYIGLAAGDEHFVLRAVELAREGADRNAGVATFEAISFGLQGLVSHDRALFDRAQEAAERSPRPLVKAGVYEDYGRELITAGDTDTGGRYLDRAWEIYDQTGALGGCAAVQRVMRTAGLRRPYWLKQSSRPVSGWGALTETEVRVARLIGAGHTNKSAAVELYVSANTVGTHLRSVFSKLDIRSRVQLANVLGTVDPVRQD